MMLLLKVTLVLCLASLCLANVSLETILRNSADACCSKTCNSQELSSLVDTLVFYKNTLDHNPELIDHAQSVLGGKRCAPKANLAAPQQAQVQKQQQARRGATKRGADSITITCENTGRSPFKCAITANAAAGITYIYTYSPSGCQSLSNNYVNPGTGVTSYNLEVVFACPSTGPHSVSSYMYNGQNYIYSDNTNPKVVNVTQVVPPITLVSYDGPSMAFKGSNAVLSATATFTYAPNVPPPSYTYIYCTKTVNNSVEYLAYGYYYFTNGETTAAYSLYLYSTAPAGEYSCALTVYYNAGSFQFNATNITVYETGCDAGKYALATGYKNFTCEDCPLGFYSAAPNSPVCTPCPQGQTSSCFSGSVGCVQCPAGSTSQAGSCVKCPKGRYSYGGYSCEYCWPGTYANTTGSSTCTSCPSGYSSERGATECKICPAGQYAYSGSDRCQECQEGYYAALPGSMYCQPCPANTYSSAASTSCSACPDKHTSNQGSFGCLRTKA